MANTKTAKSQLGLKDVRGAYIEANIDPEIQSSLNFRDSDDFHSNKIDNPAGGSGSTVNISEIWDKTR